VSGLSRSVVAGDQGLGASESLDHVIQTDAAIILGSPADKAGIIENDIVLEMDGQKIDQDHDLASMVRAKHVGDMVTLTVLSKGIQKNIKITLEAAPQE
jgi:S1-C subfamily serine protease